jgi:Tfp pilus assembly protein PilX
LSLLGLAAMMDSGLQLRMAANLGAEEAALQRARSALDWGERWLLSLDGATRPATCPGSGCNPAIPVQSAANGDMNADSEGNSWWERHAQVDGLDPLTGLRVERTPAGTTAARWRVEQLHVAPPKDESPELAWYRILARTSGDSRGGPIVLESILVRPWGDDAWHDALDRRPDQPGFCRTLREDFDCGRQAWRRLR